MSSPARSIEELLALARQRRLWPEVEPAPQEQDRAADPALPAPAPVPALAAPVPSELQQALAALAQQMAQALGPDLPAAQPLLDQVTELLAAGLGADLDAAWAALDDLEDQLEALTITARSG